MIKLAEIKTENKQIKEMRKIIVSWYINDGYASKSRTQKIIIDEIDLGIDWDEFEELTKPKKEHLINQLIQKDFVKKIRWCLDYRHDFENKNEARK